MDSANPIVRFYRLAAGARPPQRADRSACGTLPTRAFRYCQAVTSASAYGWWVFPPLDIQVMWDGHDIFWHYDGATDWLPLLPSAQLPGFAGQFDATVPADLKGCSPPFLTALPEPGALQIWTGLIARTQPDWHLLLRAPANLPTPGGFVLYEGIVETDRWFGPLFTNLRFTRSHSPIRLRADFPLLQVQPIPRHAYSNVVLDAMTPDPDLRAMDEADWDDYRSTIVVPNLDPDRPFGAYATAARKRNHRAEAAMATGRCPMGVHN
ncbi:MAG: DUF6065 family protein [Acetobacteraceae bacterium]